MFLTQKIVTVINSASYAGSPAMRLISSWLAALICPESFADVLAQNCRHALVAIHKLQALTMHAKMEK